MSQIMNSTWFVESSDGTSKIITAAKKIPGFRDLYIVDKQRSIGKKYSIVIHIEGIDEDELKKKREELSLLDSVVDVVCKSSPYPESLEQK